MNFKKLFSLTMSLLTLSCVNLSVSAMESTNSYEIKERKLIKVKFSEVNAETRKECIVLVPCGKLSTGQLVLLDKIENDGKMLPCCICKKPMYFENEYFSIFKHKDIYSQINSEKSITDPQNINKSTKMFTSLLPCCFHYNCGTKLAANLNFPKVQELYKKNKNKAPEDFTKQDVKDMETTGFTLTNCPKCGQGGAGHYDFGNPNSLSTQLMADAMASIMAAKMAAKMAAEMAADCKIF